MSIWHHAKMTSVFYDADDADIDSPCIVEIVGSRISVRYDADGNMREYSGGEMGVGHYVLACPEVNGKATLHQFADSKIMEGSWVESGTRGMWRISLA